MPFASKTNACAKNGNIKKGFREVTDKNGKIRYMTDNKKKDVKKDVKEVKKDKPKTEKAKPKGVTPEKVEKVKKVKKIVVEEEDDDNLTLNF